MKSSTKKACFLKLLVLVEGMEESNAVFDLLYPNGSVKHAKWDTCYETDNMKELDDPKYEEFKEIAFRNLETGKLFPVNYHNAPIEVWCDGKLVYKREILRRKGGKNPNTNFPANE